MLDLCFGTPEIIGQSEDASQDFPLSKQKVENTKKKIIINHKEKYHQ